MSKLEYILIVITVLVPNIVFADFTTYDLSLYNPESWNGSGDEYAGTNFWSHNYWNFTTRRDECEHRGCEYNTATHSGVDYAVTVNDNKIYSYGFGKIIQRRTSYGQVSIRHLVSTGQYFQINLLHSSEIDSNIVENHFIAKKQFIGIKGGIGADGTDVYNHHLHLEISDSVILTAPLTANAYPGPGALRPSEFAKGGLTAHYTSDNTNIRYYNPNVFANNKREAIPFLSSTFNAPSLSNYDVYGITSKQLYGYLNLTGQFHRSSIVVRDFFNRSLVENKGNLDDDHRFLGGENEDSQVDGITGNNIYIKGDYLFAAYVNNDDDRRFGYPVKFSFVNEGDIIVDNDQINNGRYKYESDNGERNKIPGYFLTAELHNGRSNDTAHWYPGVAGKYKIFIHVPEYGPTATNVVYEINGDGVSSVLTDSINMASHLGQWVELKSNGNSTFKFTESGVVSIKLSSEQERTNYDIDNNHTVAFDAIKFEKIKNSINILPTISLLLDDNKNKILSSSDDYVVINDTVTFYYDYPGINCKLNFRDGTTVSLPSCKGDISRPFLHEWVYDVQLYSENNLVASLPIIVGNQNNNWIGYVSSNYSYQEPNENYNDIVNNGRLYLPPSLSSKSYYWTQYRFVRPSVLQSVSGDNFTLEVRIKNPSNEGGISCYDPGIGIVGEDGKQAWVTFMSPGCTYYSSIGAVDSYDSGRYVDLSALGKDFSDWRVVKLEVKNNSVSVYYEGNKLYSKQYTGRVGRIFGIRQSFKGSGSVDWVKLYNDSGTLIYTEDFD